MKVLFDGELFADYHQFYIADAVSEIGLPTDWSPQAISDGVLCGGGNLIVTTARNMPVPLRIELHERQPVLDLDRVDHAVIAPLCTGGEIVIAGCMDYAPDAVRAGVPAGDLEALVVMTGLGTLSEDGLDGEDRYFIHLWPGSGKDIKVLRRWPRASHR